MTLNEIRQKRAEHWEMMKNFLDSHEDKNGNLNADDAATYANYENGLNSMPAEILIQIADYFDESLDVLAEYVPVQSKNG